MHKHAASEQQSWLTLQEASRLLGMPTTTVRRWADMGKIPVQRTLGGHRRFSRAAILQLLGQEHEVNPAPDGHLSNWGINHNEMSHQSWHTNITLHQAHGQMRELGQRLLGLLIQFISHPPDEQRYLDEAHAVGINYGRMAYDATISMHDTIQAFLFFQRSFSQMARPIPGLAQPADLSEVANLQGRIQQFMDTTLLGTIRGYELAALQRPVLE